FRTRGDNSRGFSSSRTRFSSKLDTPSVCHLLTIFQLDEVWPLGIKCTYSLLEIGQNRGGTCENFAVGNSGIRYGNGLHTALWRGYGAPWTRRIRRQGQHGERHRQDS